MGGEIEAFTFPRLYFFEWDIEMDSVLSWLSNTQSTCGNRTR